MFFETKLGALEAISKYMKENLKMSYSEIADLLNRDGRTIWTAYKKAVEKDDSPIIIGRAKIKIPLTAFGRKSLTIFESAILYLKEIGFKYSEIAKLINRDQRNVGASYLNAKKKMITFYKNL